MYFLHFHVPDIHAFLRRDLTHLLVSSAIRAFAIGMVVIFEPIYIYLFLGKSIPMTLLFFGASYGLYGLLAVFGGRVMARFGVRNAILIGNVLLFVYFVLLYALPSAAWLLAVLILVRAIAMMFYWPAFHTEFVRFSHKKDRGKEVGEMGVLRTLPVVIAPAIGGWLLANFGYPVLFTATLIVLVAAIIPLFGAKEVPEKYTDSYQKAWKRVVSPKNWRMTAALASVGAELGINRFLWPIFLVVLAIPSLQIGWITTISLAFSTFFVLYLGKLTDSDKRPLLIRAGSVLTAITWIFKALVQTPLNALLAHTLYRFGRSSVGIPFATVLYEEAAERKSEADEFIVYRSIVLNISRFALFTLLAVVLSFASIQVGFVLAAFLSLAFMLIAQTPRRKAKFV